MPYIEDRIVHDADSHLMELPQWLGDFATSSGRDAFNARFGAERAAALARLRARHDDPENRARNGAEIMLRKHHAALGSFRPEALDRMGVASHIALDAVWPQAVDAGVIELGAAWAPGFMRQLDAAFEAFSRHEE